MPSRISEANLDESLEDHAWALLDRLTERGLREPLECLTLGPVSRWISSHAKPITAPTATEKNPRTKPQDRPRLRLLLGSFGPSRFTVVVHRSRYAASHGT